MTYTVSLVLLPTMLFAFFLPACTPKQPLKAKEELETIAREFVFALAEGR